MSVAKSLVYQKIGFGLLVGLGELALLSALFGTGWSILPFWAAFGLKYLVLVFMPGISYRSKAFNRTVYLFLVLDILLSLALLTGGQWVFIGYALLSSSALCYGLALVSSLVIYVIYKMFESWEPTKPAKPARPVRKSKKRK